MPRGIVKIHGERPSSLDNEKVELNKDLLNVRSYENGASIGGFGHEVNG